jgi:hypothetical protein
MLTSIQEISNHPVVVLLYKSGASGEFLSYALTHSIDQFTKSSMEWENNNRCIVQDYFGRTLLFGPITQDILLPRINLFFEMSQSIGTKHMGLSHLKPHQIDFLIKYGVTWPVIEITTLQTVSQEFQRLSRNSKISKEYKSNYTTGKINHTAAEEGYYPPRHLQVEWSRLFLTDARAVYSQILSFLDCTGDVDYFVAMVEDYVSRNKILIQDAYEN